MDIAAMASLLSKSQLIPVGGGAGEAISIIVFAVALSEMGTSCAPGLHLTQFTNFHMR